MNIDYENFLHNIECAGIFTMAIRNNYAWEVLDPSQKVDIDMNFMSDEEIERIQLAYIAMIFSIYKEKCMDKLDKDVFSAKVADEVIENAIGFIATKKDGKYYLDTIECDSALKALDLIRNKLTHGDYYFDGDEIVFGDIELKKKPTTLARIKIKDLILSGMIICNGELFKKKDRNNRTMVISHNATESDRATNKAGLNRLCKKLYILDFKDEPIDGKECSLNYSEIVFGFIRDIKESLPTLLANNPQRSIKDIVNILMKSSRPLLAKYNIKMTCQVESVANLPYLNKIIKDFQSKLNPFDVSLEEQIYSLGLITTSYRIPDFYEQKLKAGFLNNIIILKQLKEEKNIDFKPENLLRVSDTFLDDITITSFLSLFYSQFQYGLENIYSKAGETTLFDVLNGECLDFSLLELDSLYSPTMTTIVSFKPFYDQLLTLENDKNKKENNYNSMVTRDDKQKYIDSCNKKGITPDSKKLQAFDERLNEAKEEYEKALNLYKKALLFMSRFDKFVKNYNILLNLRDSIAHGNYQLKTTMDPQKDTLLDSELTFENICNGNINYSNTIRLEDFANIFNLQNLEILREFIDKKIPKIEKTDSIQILQKGL